MVLKVDNAQVCRVELAFGSQALDESCADKTGIGLARQHFVDHRILTAHGVERGFVWKPYSRLQQLEGLGLIATEIIDTGNGDFSAFEIM